MQWYAGILTDLQGPIRYGGADAGDGVVLGLPRDRVDEDALPAQIPSLGLLDDDVDAFGGDLADLLDGDDVGCACRRALVVPVSSGIPTRPATYLPWQS